MNDLDRLIAEERIPEHAQKAYYRAHVIDGNNMSILAFQKVRAWPMGYCAQGMSDADLRAYPQHYL